MLGWMIRQSVDLNAKAPGSDAWRDALMLAGDRRAHTWEIDVRRGSRTVSLADAVAIGYFRRADGYTVVVPGTIEGSYVRVAMAQACYAVPGAVTGIVRLSTTEETITLAALKFIVAAGVGDYLVDPGDAIPDIGTLLAQVAEMEAATASANEAAASANEAAASVDEALAALSEAEDYGTIEA